MIGVTARALQGFVTDGYGRTAWQDVTRAARRKNEKFELLLPYPRALTLQIVSAAAERLGRPRSEMLEELGIYLVTHPNNEAVRRMLRFSGSNFEAFVEALPELPDRVRLVLPHVKMPPLRLAWAEDGHYLIDCRADNDVTHHILLGMIRAMADDFGALAMTDLQVDATQDGAAQEGWHRLSVEVPSYDFASGRSFELQSGGLAS